MRWGLSSLRAPGRAVALGVVVVAVMLRALDIGIIPESRLRFFDLEERLWPRSSDPARVAIVDIDERSLAQYGQWLWPRDLGSPKPLLPKGIRAFSASISSLPSPTGSRRPRSRRECRPLLHLWRTDSRSRHPGAGSPTQCAWFPTVLRSLRQSDAIPSRT